MKNTIKGYIAGFISSAILVGGISYAANSVRIVLDGKELIPIDANGNRVEAQIIDGTTYLPVRAVANAFGKAVYWDGPTSTVYLGNYNGDLQYPMVKMIDMNDIGGSNYAWRQANTLTDNYENHYSNTLWCEYNRTSQYILDGKYTRLKGTLYVGNGESNNNTAGLVITADGKDIYTSPAMSKTSRPVDIDVDITGCNVLELTHTGDDFSIYFGNAGLYQ